MTIFPVCGVEKSLVPFADVQVPLNHKSGNGWDNKRQYFIAVSLPHCHSAEWLPHTFLASWVAWGGWRVEGWWVVGRLDRVGAARTCDLVCVVCVVCVCVCVIAGII